jgi:DDE superfamily endonuclease
LAARETLEHESGSALHAKKKWRDRLIALARGHPDGVVGFQDAVWWSRLAQPYLHIWTDDKPVHLSQNAPDRHAPEPKAVAWYGLLRTDTQGMLLRCVHGRPVSAVTTQFLAWLTERVAAEGKTALLLVWDNAAWHVSHAVRAWRKAHKRRVKRDGGCRVVVCPLSSKSPWLNRIEPKWVHGKRAIAEPARKLHVDELKHRICAYYDCELLDPIAQ